MMVDLIEMLEEQQHLGITSVPPQKSTVQQLTRQRDLRLQAKAHQLRVSMIYLTHSLWLQNRAHTHPLPPEGEGLSSFSNDDAGIYSGRCPRIWRLDVEPQLPSSVQGRLLKIFFPEDLEKEMEKHVFLKNQYEGLYP